MTGFERQRLRSIAFHRGIGIDIRLEGNTVIVEQLSAPDGYIRSNQELYDIGRRWYPDKDLSITPVVFSLQLAEITPEWISKQIERYKMSRNTIIRQTGITASELSDYLKGRRSMIRTTRAMFYYFFLTYQLNSELREEPISPEEIAEAIALIKERKQVF